MGDFTSKYSLVEQRKRLDPNGSTAKIIEILNKEIPIFEDAPWMQSNDIWQHKTTRRGTLPSGTWRKLNSGVATEVSRTTEVMDTIGMLETYCETDQEYIDNAPDPMQARWTESKAFIEGLAQTFASAILYSNGHTNPDQIHGLAPRLNTIDDEFVWGGGGSGGDTTSIFVVTWGEDRTHMVYPKNSGANLGITHTNKGQVTLTSATTAVPATAQYEGYRDHYQIKGGFVSRDPRCIGRYANIEVSGSSNLFNEDILIKLLSEMKVDEGTRIYVNSTIASQMQIAAKDKNNIYYTLDGGDGLSGAPLLRFNSVPIRKMNKDILLNTETVVGS